MADEIIGDQGPSEHEDTDLLKEKLEQKQIEALLPLKEDLSEWLNKILGL